MEQLSKLNTWSQESDVIFQGFFISRFQVYIVVNQALLLSLSFKDILVVTGTSKNTFISKFNQEHDTNCITRKKIGEQEVNCRK